MEWEIHLVHNYFICMLIETTKVQELGIQLRKKKKLKRLKMMMEKIISIFMSLFLKRIIIDISKEE